VLDAQLIHDNPPKYWQEQGGTACWFALGRLFVHGKGKGTDKFLSQGRWIVAVVEQKGLQQRIGRGGHFGERYRQTSIVPPNDPAGKANEKLSFRSVFPNGQGTGGGWPGWMRRKQEYPGQAEIPALAEDVGGAVKADADHAKGDAPIAASIDHGVCTSLDGVLMRGLVAVVSALKKV
jgi:hypothetical protein